MVVRDGSAAAGGFVRAPEHRRQGTLHRIDMAAAADTAMASGYIADRILTCDPWDEYWTLGGRAKPLALVAPTQSLSRSARVVARTQAYSVNMRSRAVTSHCPQTRPPLTTQACAYSAEVGQMWAGNASSTSPGR